MIYADFPADEKLARPLPSNVTRVVGEGGAGGIFGRYVGPESHVGGWNEKLGAGNRAPIDPAAAKAFGAKVPADAIFVSNYYENQFDAYALRQHAIQLATVQHCAGVGLYGFPTADTATNARVHRALGRYLTHHVPWFYCQDAHDTLTHEETTRLVRLLQACHDMPGSKPIMLYVSPNDNGAQNPVPTGWNLAVRDIAYAMRADLCVWTDRPNEHAAATVEALAA